jgi:hypothetical protein
MADMKEVADEIILNMATFPNPPHDGYRDVIDGLQERIGSSQMITGIDAAIGNSYSSIYVSREQLARYGIMSINSRISDGPTCYDIAYFVKMDNITNEDYDRLRPAGLPTSWAVDWGTDAVIGLVRHWLATHNDGMLPYLADALEEAGCGIAVATNYGGYYKSHEREILVSFRNCTPYKNW